MSALIQLANQYSNEKALSFDTKNLANDIIGRVAAADADGRQDAFLTHKCAEGFGSAFYSLSHKATPENAALMKSFMAKNDAEQAASLTHRGAVGVAGQYALLNSADADAWLEECLGNNQSEHLDRTAWALAAARERKMTSLPGILRRRLDQSLADAQARGERRRSAGM